MTIYVDCQRSLMTQISHLLKNLFVRLASDWHLMTEVVIVSRLFQYLGDSECRSIYTSWISWISKRNRPGKRDIPSTDTALNMVEDETLPAFSICLQDVIRFWRKSTHMEAHWASMRVVYTHIAVCRSFSSMFYLNFFCAEKAFNS